MTAVPLHLCAPFCPRQHAPRRSERKKGGGNHSAEGELGVSFLRVLGEMLSAEGMTEDPWPSLWVQAAHSPFTELGPSLSTKDGTAPAFIKSREENIFARG